MTIGAWGAPLRRMRSVAGKISGGDQAFAGHDNPSVASELDTLNASRAGEKIPLANFALAIAAADQRDVIASVEHDIPAQKRLWTLDRTCPVHRHVVKFGPSWELLGLRDLRRR